MVNNVCVFGCSFSSGYLEVPQSKSYGNLLARELNLNIKNFAKPGNSNDKIFYDLLSNVDLIQDNDIIIYQFSSFNRLGFFKDDNEDSYFSSAGIIESGIEDKLKKQEFKEFSFDNLNNLVNFIIDWQKFSYKFTIDNTINILNFLIKTKKIIPIILFMTDECIFLNDYTIKLPIESDKNNFSLHSYVRDNKLTIGDEFVEKYSNGGDEHPGFSGHNRLKEIILLKIKNNKIKWV